MTNSFLWYDLETWGRDPRTSRIAQFAAQRTDLDLNPVGAPVNLLCRAADDLLPSPEASLITGLTPQDIARDGGLVEADFFARVCEQLSQPGTCAVGYNSIRFDDEFLRFGLYRNFYDPYEREWKDGNSRWDLLDFLRLARALRPDGLEWPLREDGSPSFKLEDLAIANGTREGSAHEALSDVRALIGLARKLRAAQPKLWDYALALRDKRHCAGLVNVAGPPLLHVSGRYPASRLCSALVLPLAIHPRIDSRVIVIDLDVDPQLLADASADEIADRLYTPAADLPEGVQRVPLKEVHLNKCPVLVPLAHVRDADLERLGLDRAQALARAATLRAMDGVAEKVRQVFARDSARPEPDADGALYAGFPSPKDKRLLPVVRSTAPGKLHELASAFSDPRYPELLFRYQARNWPESLDAAGRARWDDYRRARLTRDAGLSENDLPCYFATLAALRANPDAPQALLDRLEAWGRGIEASL
jgi:exodeoxyribonuclease-1